MTRPTPTRELVRTIATAALARGETPTQAMIRRVILEEHDITASPNLVMDELNKFMSNAGRMAVRRFSLPDMPAEIGEAVSTLWELACQKADEKVVHRMREAEDREIKAENAIKASDHLLTEERIKTTTLTHDLAMHAQSLDQKTQAYEALQAQVNELRAQINERTVKIDSLMDRNADLAADKIRTEATCAQRITEIESNAKEEMARIRAEQEKQIEKLHSEHVAEAQTWEGLRKHLLNQTDQIRQAAKYTDEKQRALIADLELRCGVLTRKANDTTQEVSKLTGIIETLNVQISKLEQTDLRQKSRINEHEGAATLISQWLAFKNAELHAEYLEKFKLKLL